MAGRNRRSDTQGFLVPEINRITAITSTLRSSQDSQEPTGAAYARHQNLRSADPYFSHVASARPAQEVVSDTFGLHPETTICLTLK